MDKDKDKYILFKVSSDQEVDIYIADEDRNLVQKGHKSINTRLLRGVYLVHFGLHGAANKIDVSSEECKGVVIDEIDGCIQIVKGLDPKRE